MKKYSIFIGVDISKLTLDIVGINSKNIIVKNSLEINNNKKEIKRYFNHLKTKYLGNKIIVCFENTGLYGYYLSNILSEMQIDYAMVPALEIHLSKGLVRGKSDKKDALMIAHYLLSNQFKIKISTLNEFDIDKLKVLNSQRDRIVKAISIFRHTYESKDFLPKELTKETYRINDSILNNLKKNLVKIEKEIKKIIDDSESLKINYNLIRSIPGIGPQTSVYLLIVTKNFTAFKDGRKLACYAGVAPFPYQSGTSINGRTKVHHFADKKLKSLINMCALNAIRWDTEISIYYEKKVAEGKNKMLVMNNVRNKLLHRVFAVIKRQTPYVNTLKYVA
jgi:transposase